MIIGKRNASAIGTLVERSSGYTMLVHLPEGYKPEQVAPALAAKIQTLPAAVRRSLTWDQGPEMRDWKHVKLAAEIDIYFCDPHSPWQLLSFYCSLTVLSRDFADTEVVAGSSPMAWRGWVFRWKRSCLRCSPAGCR